MGRTRPVAGSTAGNVSRRLVTLGPAEAGLRLDVALAGLLPDESRSSLQRLIREGNVTLGGRPLRPSTKCEAGWVLEVVLPAPRAAEAAPEEIPLSVLYEDGDMVVVDKPAGLVTHPGPGHASGTLVNALLFHSPSLSGVGGVLRPGIVHRLDKGTSGVLVAAKNDRAHRLLAAQFKGRTVRKTYLALAWGNVRQDAGEISLAIGRDRKDRKRVSPRTDKPREAATSYRVARRFGALTLLEVSPMTGRTHQIRVHLAHLGHPIVGDPVYGRRAAPAGLPAGLQRALAGVDRMMLHAWRIALRRPGDGVEVEFSAPPPPDFRLFMEAAP